MKNNQRVLLDCTLRDGGYYNSWNFEPTLISSYLSAIDSLSIDACEIGYRSNSNKGFKGAHAYSKDEYLDELSIPGAVKIGVMVNGAELEDEHSLKNTVSTLFPRDSPDSLVKLVRIACDIKHAMSGFKA